MEKRIVNLVNFVRGCEPRKPTDLVTPTRLELEQDRKYGLKSTYLLQYDAMTRADFRELFLRERTADTELGVWFEMGRELTESVGIPWRGRPGYDWDWYVNPGFLQAYTPAEREWLIDEVFRKFREIFGEYPAVAGSWILDSHSLAYMSEHYQMKAFCVCREQLSIDAYTLWGGMFNGGYYPSRKNMLCPAQTEENQIGTPVFRMLGPDPIYSYEPGTFFPGMWDCCTLEPGWKFGREEVTADWYFRTYLERPCLSFSHLTTGQENSFGWKMLGEGYCLQARKLAELQKAGKVRVETLGETGDAFRKSYRRTPPQALCSDGDWAGNGIESFWYGCARYRANLFLHGDRLFLRDVNLFDENYEERYLRDVCTAWDGRYDNLPVADHCTWSREGNESGVFFADAVEKILPAEEGNDLSVTVLFADGRQGKILLSEDGITVSGCGEMLYRVGEPAASVALDGDTFRYVYRDFPYAMKVIGTIVPGEAGEWKILPVGGTAKYIFEGDFTK